MPNWCNNTVTFSHPDAAEVRRMYQALTADEPALFQEFMPCPDELKTSTPVGDDFAERDAAREKANEEKYGYIDWYNWCLDNWGTKWDISDADVTYTDGDTHLRVSFDTAWGPAIGFYEYMEDELDWQIDAFYYEPGMNFCGRYNYGDDEYHEITGDSHWVKANIPLEIDEMYDISGQMREWEGEDAEEDAEPEFDFRDNLIVITDDKTVK